MARVPIEAGSRSADSPRAEPGDAGRSEGGHHWAGRPPPPPGPLPIAAPLPAALAVSGGAAIPELRRLKLLGIGLPVVLIVIFEIVRALVLRPLMGDGLEHAIGAAVIGAGAIAFGLAMFLLIERGHRQIVRRNRELAAVNAVATALQGDLGVDHVIDGALRSVLASTGASDASVTVFGGTAGPTDEGVTRRVVAPVPAGPARGSDGGRLVDLPLSTGTAVVGRLRLTLPYGAADPDFPAANALANIGHQLACAIQTTQLLADLQRRQTEGHAFYDVLLQISSQYALADILGGIVRYARDLLAADDAAVALSEPASQSLERDGASGTFEPLGGGAFCVTPNADHFRNAHVGADVCPVRSSPEYVAVLDVPMLSPAGSLGDIWIGRRRGPPYSARDRASLATLARLGTIAITSARLREGERQAAVLAERDRIAREMHDSLAQVLGMTHLRLRAIVAGGELAGLPRVRDELADIADVSHEAYQDVREAILGLRESSHLRGLTAGLQAYLARFSHQSGIRVTLDAAGDEPPLAASTEIQVIRVIQEALTNARKHAIATEVVVRITQDVASEAVVITIEDNGRGFDLGRTLLDRDAGFGLHTMRERMELVGGSLEIESSPGAGTRVVARAPVVQHPVPATTGAARGR